MILHTYHFMFVVIVLRTVATRVHCNLFSSRNAARLYNALSKSNNPAGKLPWLPLQVLKIILYRAIYLEVLR